MKKLLLLFVATFLLLQSCQTESNLAAYAPHFHAKAVRSGENVKTNIMIPGRYGDKLVYLKSVKPVKEVRLSPKNRNEFVLAEITFTTEKDEMIKTTDYQWNQDCGTLSFVNKIPTNVSIASIIVNVPEGIEKKYIKSENHSKKECYNWVDKVASLPNNALFGFIFLHQGHGPKDPEFGEDGIVIENGNG